MKGVWSLRLSSLSLSPSPPLLPPSLLLLVFGVVRAQLCEHARYPRTPLCSLVVFSLLSSLLPAFLHAPPFLLLWNGGGGFTMCRCVVLA